MLFVLPHGGGGYAYPYSCLSYKLFPGAPVLLPLVAGREQEGIWSYLPLFLQMLRDGSARSGAEAGDRFDKLLRVRFQARYYYCTTVVVCARRPSLRSTSVSFLHAPCPVRVPGYYSLELGQVRWRVVLRIGCCTGYYCAGTGGATPNASPHVLEELAGPGVSFGVSDEAAGRTHAQQ